MPQKLEYTIILFYSNYNQASLNTRLALNEFIENHHHAFKISAKAVNCDSEKNLCRQYDVAGLPTLLVFLNQELAGRYYGEITYEEYESIIQENLKQGG